MNKKIIFLTFAIFLLAAGCNIPGISSNTTNTNAPSPVATSTAPAKSPPPIPTPALAPNPVTKVVPPISRPEIRITKKFFGTYITPQNSPVSPERFTGYHTGLDFETFPEEQNTDVAVNAICRGKLLRKGYASGYGGYAVESCEINSQAVTVVYGHLRQSSIKPALGQELSIGAFLAVLGTGYSQETDGERKHLHLGVHIGSVLNIKGYVQTKSELSGWLDPQSLLEL